MTQETADFSEPPPGYTRSEDPYEQMCITSEGLFFNSDRGWHRSDGRPLRWLTFEAAWAEHKAACPMASDIQQGLLLGSQIAEIEETLRQPWPRTNGQDLGEAHIWRANGFVDSEVVAWLEAGVFRPITARFLQLERIAARELVRECTAGETLGYAFCAGTVSFKAVKRILEGVL